MTTVQGGTKCGFDWINKAKLAVSVNFIVHGKWSRRMPICWPQLHTKKLSRGCRQISSKIRVPLSGDAIARWYRYSSVRISSLGTVNLLIEEHRTMPRVAFRRSLTHTVMASRWSELTLRRILYWPCTVS